MNKKIKATERLLAILVHKKLLAVDQLTNKNIYMLANLGNHKFNKNKTIRINDNELKYQDMLIKWLAQQKDILSYQIEKELKREVYLEKMNEITALLTKVIQIYYFTMKIKSWLLNLKKPEKANNEWEKNLLDCDIIVKINTMFYL